MLVKFADDLAIAMMLAGELHVFGVAERTKNVIAVHSLVAVLGGVILY